MRCLPAKINVARKNKPLLDLLRAFASFDQPTPRPPRRLPDEVYFCTIPFQLPRHDELAGEQQKKFIFACAVCCTGMREAAC